jgi:intracellular sulfur oxidation DsrE/DsrF family protein
MRTVFHRFVTCLAAWLAVAAPAGAATATVGDLLARTVAPAGLVFEVVDRDPGALAFALPWVKDAAQRLRARHPGVPMALVTHGQEMFALQSATRERSAAIHGIAESLSRDEGISVHVCETHAGWRGVAAEDFPPYVDVAPSGPAQIRSYEALDYVRVVVPRATVLRAR